MISPISPCIRVCRLEKGVCIGCLRTSKEITNWFKLSDKEKIKILKRIEKVKTK